MAQTRVEAAKGVLILRNEDLDRSRCRLEFVQGFYDDLRWFGFDWQEGPDIGGPFAPYSQSERIELYRSAFQQLIDRRLVYPCTCSRLDVQRALQAPHQGEEEPLYPGTCRDRTEASGERINWRFRVPDGEVINFHDGHFGPQSFKAGRDFGDFVVWRQDGLPSYQLGVVVDDASMEVTEVVRGADLLLSTARQILLFRALGWPLPAFYHCPLMLDAQGKRLAKRVDSLSLRHFREEGLSPEELRNQWHQPAPQPCTH